MSLRFSRLVPLFAVPVVVASLSLTAATTTGATGSEQLPVQVSTRPVLQDLEGVEELRTIFNRDAGKVRLVLLLSPT